MFLENRLREAAEEEDLVVPSDEFQSPEDIKGAFRQGSRERVFRYTWPIDSTGPVFTTTGWRYFFDLTVRMLADSTLTGVQALLVLDDLDLLTSPNVKRLLTFYSTTAGMEAKVVIKQDFQAIAARNNLPEDRVDFGLYDNSLLYLTENANGRFTKNEYRIARYLRLFETIWFSGGVVVEESRNVLPDHTLLL